MLTGKPKVGILEREGNTIREMSFLLCGMVIEVFRPFGPGGHSSGLREQILPFRFDIEVSHEIRIQIQPLAGKGFWEPSFHSLHCECGAKLITESQVTTKMGSKFINIDCANFAFIQYFIVCLL